MAQKGLWKIAHKENVGRQGSDVQAGRPFNQRIRSHAQRKLPQ